ncbi:type II toxin-antitoxin system tRNA(fMet)-specific endonuclease VapC [Faucicola boevrei]|uniref:type II toxin-antitoxin system tRNA(fMet)-specific endonuclease VapC n=1 Tax=Faucicola boevrei TaxID=346665 RepID=UPI000374A457|nr:tRNA(fMet)-specific endonuclease VapC [Moraxella boevrei]
MMTYMLDTNICIYAMKNKPLMVRERFNFFQNQLCISSVILMELAVGAEKSMYKEKAFKALDIFKDSLTVLEFDDNASYHTANIKATLEKQGTPIGAYDTMIAGHARSLGLIVVTNNEKELKRVDGLRVENWTLN